LLGYAALTYFYNYQTAQRNEYGTPVNEYGTPVNDNSPKIISESHTLYCAQKTGHKIADF
jgi:hypothetical protein